MGDSKKYPYLTMGMKFRANPHPPCGHSKTQTMQTADRADHADRADCADRAD